jgi:hypothetical protein
MFLENGMGRRFWIAAAGLAALGVSLSAIAQTTAPVPFISAGATVGTPEIGYAATGEEMDVQQAVASQDRKYVTLNLNPQFSTLLRFQSFTYQTSTGFVGSAPMSTSAASATGNTAKVAAQTFLDRPGMTRVAVLPMKN